MRQNQVQLLENLYRDEHYARHNILRYEYTEDVIRQWLKNHYEWLESARDSNEDLRSVWIDLNSAIESLKEPEKTVVRLYAEGYRSTALVEASKMPDAPSILAKGVTGMVSYLRRKE